MSPCIAARRDADGYCTSSCSPLSNADVAIACAFESAAFAIYGRATRTDKNTARSNQGEVPRSPCAHHDECHSGVRAAQESVLSPAAPARGPLTEGVPSGPYSVTGLCATTPVGHSVVGLPTLEPRLV